MPAPNVLAAAHRRAQQQLQTELEQNLELLIQTLPDLGQDNLEWYARNAALRTAATQTRSAQLGAGYVLTLLGPDSPTRRQRRTIDIEAALEGVRVDASSPVAVAPVLRARSLETELGLELAKGEAGTYAAQLGSGDVQAAQRAGLDAGAASSGVRIGGWTKELGPTACPWCQAVSGERVYGSASSVPFHDNDRCSVAPVTD